MGEPARPNAVGVRTKDLDVTDALETFASQTARSLQEAGISGYILKRGSPSCGMERVKIYNPKGMPSQSGSGIYARVLMEVMPLLPVEEEGRLGDPVLRENFIQRVFVFSRWQPTPSERADAAQRTLIQSPIVFRSPGRSHHPR